MGKDTGAIRRAALAKGFSAAVAIGLWAFAMAPAIATHPEVSLPNSNFEIDTDANLKVDDGAPSLDWANVNEARKTDTVSGQTDESFGKGTAEDDAVPTVVDGGIPPEKSDLKVFGLYQEGSNISGFLTLFWTRVQEPNGTTNMDFELNQRRCTPNQTPADPDCTSNGITPIRSVGDKLITYDLSKGGTVPVLSIRTWGGSAWGPAVDLSGSGDARGSINSSAIPATESDGLGALSARTFGEAHIKLSALFSGTSGCAAFGSAYLKSRASDSFTAALKDFVPPQNVMITNCGAVNIHKQDDSGAAMSGVEFELYKDLGTVGGVREATTIDTLTNPRLACTTDSNGDCTITTVPFGNYWVHEVAAPSGFTAAADQTASVSAGTSTVSVTFVNTRNPASVTLHKQDDAGVALANVTFTLYNDFGTVGGTREATNIDTVVTPTKSCATDASGNCTISGIVPAGNFWLVETVPDGYAGAPDRAITLTLGQALDITANPFVNARQFRVVTFVCIDTTDTLYGAKVSYDGASLPGSSNTPVVGGTVTSTVESAICGLTGSAVHSGGPGSHSASVSIP